MYWLFAYVQQKLQREDTCVEGTVWLGVQGVMSTKPFLCSVETEDTSREDNLLGPQDVFF
jgi:hypothetical protein